MHSITGHACILSHTPQAQRRLTAPLSDAPPLLQHLLPRCVPICECGSFSLECPAYYRILSCLCIFPVALSSRRSYTTPPCPLPSNPPPPSPGSASPSSVWTLAPWAAITHGLRQHSKKSTANIFSLYPLTSASPQAAALAPETRWPASWTAQAAPGTACISFAVNCEPLGPAFQVFQPSAAAAPPRAGWRAPRACSSSSSSSSGPSCDAERALFPHLLVKNLAVAVELHRGAAAALADRGGLDGGVVWLPALAGGSGYEGQLLQTPAPHTSTSRPVSASQ